MKIRIKGNSVRLRLSMSEVASLAQTGYLEETTVFGETSFIYGLQATEAATDLTASFNGSKITVLIPLEFIRDWPVNNTVGFNSKMPLTDTDSLQLQVEKDFSCLDDTTEDQSDFYENPNKTC